MSKDFYPFIPEREKSLRRFVVFFLLLLLSSLFNQTLQAKGYDKKIVGRWSTISLEIVSDDGNVPPDRSSVDVNSYSYHEYDFSANGGMDFYQYEKKDGEVDLQSWGWKYYRFRIKKDQLQCKINGSWVDAFRIKYIDSNTLILETKARSKANGRIVTITETFMKGSRK